MIKKIENHKKKEFESGGFRIQILLPGKELESNEDTGIGTIGRIDHAKVSPGTLVPMHRTKMMKF